jgi:hypothetical protein
MQTHWFPPDVFGLLIYLRPHSHGCLKTYSKS